MILVYHNVLFKSENNLTVPLFTFIRQMIALKKSKYRVVHLDEYDANDERQVVLRFDDGYKGVFKYALPVLSFFKYPFEVFLVEDFYRQGEQGNPQFMNKNELLKLVENNARLQYHSQTHLDLSLINDRAVMEKEIICPKDMKELDKAGFKFFAYPFWKFNELAIDVIKDHYQGALSGNGFSQHNNYSLDGIRVDKNTLIK